MVSDLVEIHTLSYKENATPVKWSCDGVQNFKLKKELESLGEQI